MSSHIVLRQVRWVVTRSHIFLRQMNHNQVFSHYCSSGEISHYQVFPHCSADELSPSPAAVPSHTARYPVPFLVRYRLTWTGTAALWYGTVWHSQVLQPSGTLRLTWPGTPGTLHRQVQSNVCQVTAPFPRYWGKVRPSSVGLPRHSSRRMNQILIKTNFLRFFSLIYK